MKYILLLLLLPTITLADDGQKFIRLGLGMDSTTLPSTKMVSAGYSNKLTSIFDYKLEGGAFDDINESQGPIAFGGPSLGISTKTKAGAYGKVFFGPALISQTDSRLGGIFEFQTDLELGLTDYRGVSLGVSFKHISDAGITSTNLGRDIIGITIGVP